MSLGSILAKSALFSLTLFYFATSAAAQTSPEIFVTWASDSSVPLDSYIKALPSRGSEITASVEVLEQGRPVNLTDMEVRWYSNDQFLRSGIGLTTLTFTAQQVASRYDLRVVLKNFRGADIPKTVSIPLTSPLVIIDVPYPDRSVPEEIFVKARTFFFSPAAADDLRITWKVNEQVLPSAGSDPFSASINLQGGEQNQPVQLSAEVTNSLNLLQRATTALTLTLQ